MVALRDHIRTAGRDSIDGLDCFKLRCIRAPDPRCAMLDMLHSPIPLVNRLRQLLCSLTLACSNDGHSRAGLGLQLLHAALIFVHAHLPGARPSALGWAPWNHVPTSRLICSTFCIPELGVFSTIRTPGAVSDRSGCVHLDIVTNHLVGSCLAGARTAVLCELHCQGPCPLVYRVSHQYCQVFL